MRVYHGSSVKIELIDLSKCRIGTDFGQGFYVTKLLEQAKQWAKIRSRHSKTDGIVTEFDFIDGEISKQICNIKNFDECNEEWLDFVVENRNSTSLKHNYDIVEGPVADDDITEKINEYIDGRIEKKNFLNDLTFRRPNHQICFCSFRSLQLLKSKCETDKYYNVKEITKFIVGKLVFELNFNEEKAFDLFYTSKTFENLSVQNINLNEKFLDDIFELLKSEII